MTRRTCSSKSTNKTRTPSLQPVSPRPVSPCCCSTSSYFYLDSLPITVSSRPPISAPSSRNFSSKSSILSVKTVKPKWGLPSTRRTSNAKSGFKSKNSKKTRFTTTTRRTASQSLKWTKSNSSSCNSCSKKRPNKPILWLTLILFSQLWITTFQWSQVVQKLSR